MQDHTEQLLDYVHGRLDPEARSKLQAMLERTPAMRAELAAIEAVQAEIAQSDLEHQRDADWERLSRAIEAERMPQPANDNRRFSLLQVAAVALAAVFVTQFLTMSLGPRLQAPGFVPASAVADAPVLQVAFRADARVADISALLQDVNATIVDGPGAMGLLTLAFEDAALRDAALASLSARSDLVEIVSQP